MLGYKYQIELADFVLEYLPRVSKQIEIKNTIISQHQFEDLITKSSHMNILQLGENKITYDREFDFKIDEGSYKIEHLCLKGLDLYNKGKNHFNCIIFI